MMANFIALVNYFKTAKLILRGAPRYIFAADKRFQPRVADGRAEGFQFFARAFGDQCDAAVDTLRTTPETSNPAATVSRCSETRRPARAGIKNFQAAAAGNWHLLRHAAM